MVAVKTCKDEVQEDQKKKFIQEGRILRQYDHPNIVKFVGIAAQRNPVMIVMEYVSGMISWNTCTFLNILAYTMLFGLVI